LLGEVAGERLGCAVGEVDAELAHDFEDSGWTCTAGVVPADAAMCRAFAACSNSASLIWERPALCRQTNRTLLIAPGCRRGRCDGGVVGAAVVLLGDEDCGGVLGCDVG
jgi:hypothetical protein